MGGGGKTKDVLNNYLCNEWNKNYANIEYVLNFLCLDIFWQKNIYLCKHIINSRYSMVENLNLTKGKERVFAYIDECGGYGFDFSKNNNSSLFIIAAIIVKESNIKIIEDGIAEIRKQNFSGSEIKSKNIGGNCKRREKVIKKTLDFPYSIFALIVDKRTVFADSGIRKSKPVFYKFLNQLVYKELRSKYPYLNIVTDQVGKNDYVQEFVRYVKNHREQLSLFDEENFEPVDSKSTNGVQLADLIAGTLAYIYEDEKKKIVPEGFNFLDLLNKKISKIQFFPQSYDNSLFEHEDGNPDYKKSIVTVAYRKATSFINENKSKEDEDIQRQVFVLDYLLFRFRYNSFRKYISTKELMGALARNNFPKITEQAFRNKVIGKLRDKGVIISSSPKGYKLPSSEKEIFDYYHHVNSVVMPMIHRLNLCNESLMMSEDCNVDYLEKGNFVGLQKIDSAYKEISHNSK